MGGIQKDDQETGPGGDVSVESRGTQGNTDRNRRVGKSKTMGKTVVEG